MFKDNDRLNYALTNLIWDRTMKKLPVGIQTFSELIEENYVYIDKTKIIYNMITTGKCYFFARPRRFGKSLLVSTLTNIFSGRKELFEGLAIRDLSFEWKEYPIIKLTLSDIPCTSGEIFEEGIRLYLQDIAQYHGITLETTTPVQALQKLVKTLSKNNRVVLLIDEYDYPILQHINNALLAEKMRDILKDFYIAIKGLDEYLKFIFFTGVSKFSKTSLFSGLNNLEDISLNNRYNNLVGYTKTEIITFFKEHLEDISEKNNISMHELLNKITQWYDGYQFTKHTAAEKIYNPFSVLLCLKNNNFSNYWFATGTPTFLINLLKAKNYPIQDFDHIEATEIELGTFDIDTIPLKTLLFQTGYLTIHHYNSETNNYVLTFPNLETSTSLMEHIFASMTHSSGAFLNTIIGSLVKMFNDETLESLHGILTQLFAMVPYTIHINEEKYYQTIFYLILKMVGADIIVEQPTNIGRIDAVLQTKKTYFIIEFKINTSAAVAIAQIKSKKYYQSYKGLGKKIILVGIAFDTTLKNVSEVSYKAIE